MLNPVEKLTKILQFEAEMGCEDRAMLGGLSRYTETWLREAGQVFGEEAGAWCRDIAARLYAYSMLPDAAARREALQALLEALKQAPVLPARPVERKAPRPQPPPQPTPPRPERESAGLDAPVTVLRGVGPRQAKRLARLGVRTIRDLLYLFPRRYNDYSQLKTINRLEYGEEVTVIAQVWDAGTRRTRGGGELFKAILSDGTGFVEATWFNQTYLADKIKRGQHISVSGKVDEYMGRLCFSSPEWEPLDDDMVHTGRIVPVYPLVQGIGAKWLRDLTKHVVDYWSRRLTDYMPPSIIKEAGLMSLGEAIAQIHFPESQMALQCARYRLAFDELFLLQIGLLRQYHQWRAEAGRPLQIDMALLDRFVASLPFRLTQAQQKVLQQIISDLRSERPMNRLLQGDVGSGKTVVAAAALALATAAGAQAALMAPTAILAEQHYHTLTRLFEHWPGRKPVVRLLTGNVTPREREEIYAGLADGSIDLVVGTHALIQEGVQFKELVLAVIDEQHRFGVRQRAALRQKGYSPHLLVMTATPIPRSLQLTIWGNLDVSVIDEMPPGRKPITTRVIGPAERERAYSFLRSQVAKGRQAFIICPLIEESESIEAAAAVEEYERLQKYVFPDLRVGLLHGRMKGEEKEGTMRRFAQGELDILVSTSVIEVGIDVPNATVILIEGAERFGLAQLHQFRGRVGRGEHPSYCLLVANSSAPEAQERLKAVESTLDGFALAQKDLEMRGPGDFLGTRQAGFPELKLANVTDLRLVESARQAAQRLFNLDPQLAHPDHRLLARQVAQFWREEGGEIS
ncbi:MAG: ATP-dependent DNA helicase RecG [Anaerolineae bacterium]|nr:ATP-dependent DNA helicase RecG [Anaerolineae bacterium]